MQTPARRLAVVFPGTAFATALGLGAVAAWETSTVASNYVFLGHVTIREFQVAPETLGDGSSVGLALAKDGRGLFIAGRMNNVVRLVDRRTEKVTAGIGYLGRNGGGFDALHMIAVDSRGNLYTGEVDPNNRVQRFLLT